MILCASVQRVQTVLSQRNGSGMVVARIRRKCFFRRYTQAAREKETPDQDEEHHAADEEERMTQGLLELAKYVMPDAAAKQRHRADISSRSYST
ncbi:MAG: hypothetical protein PHZ00_01620 [Candidatus Peribacteraceae bacterium]|nr:hypothetical protein [Candidatus Peribacteraceae bacterium]